MYHYKARIENVVDGDTVDAFVDLGFKTWVKIRFRLTGLDAAEKNTPRGIATLNILKAIEGKDVFIESTRPDKYGRYLAEIWSPTANDYSYNYQLIRAGIVKPYHGDSRSELWTAEELADGSIWVDLI